MISVISEDSFLTQVLADFCFFSLGAAASCLLKIIIPSKKTGFKAKRFAFLCVFLSFSAIFYTILIFSSHSLSWPMDFSKSHSHYYLMLCVIFGCGGLISFFWKILVPVSIVFYVLISIFTNSLMIKIFGEQKTVIPINIEEKSQKKDISLIHCPLSDVFVLPIRRNWFCEGDFLTTEDKKILKNPIVRLYAEKILLKNLSDAKKIPIPETEIFPSLYSAHITFEKNTLKCEIKKDL